MNLLLTRNFVYCFTLLFRTSCTIHLIPPNDVFEKQNEIEEKEWLDEEKAMTKAEMENIQREDALIKKQEEVEGDDRPYGILGEELKKSKIKFANLENAIMQQKWCGTVRIQEVCPNKNVTFWLYNKKAYSGYHLDDGNIKTIKEAPFLHKVPIKILLHGYNGSKSYTPNIEIRPKYIKKGYNVISIDYRNVSLSPCSIQAYKNLARVAKCFVKFILKLTNMNFPNINITLDDYHIIGFDIGAQLAGKAGLILGEQDEYLRRITALDACLPIFAPFSNYISQKSAIFVDAIHTNIMTYGKLAAYGSCDFYVNKARTPGPCKLTDAECNHKLAAVLFAESIDGQIPFCGFELFSKTHTAVMGEYCPFTTRGVYTVTTNNKPPYARGCNESDIEHNQHEKSTLIKVNKTHTIRI